MFLASDENRKWEALLLSKILAMLHNHQDRQQTEPAPWEHRVELLFPELIPIALKLFADLQSYLCVEIRICC